ncbi:uncharacterized protein K452DRAFT_291791 [Aplosporella prunicola CBS 121167]|uniref:AAA+ ATPase domain-containing protein n=1 Tax=Aplosporella prunicola CBS 121167 TaxID=1176127 RepID=A0A6A6B292_9PEZI|nr:uncharacterized protein K452DRAFT_291791 [Aplosporella prunicola CBS 121167]KAF2137137.1 hypothetical protein K452DRAFT_291791 [Aplosporella prunicola CBS 121167]
MFGGFLADESDDEEDYAAVKAAQNKRKLFAQNIAQQPSMQEASSFEMDEDLPDQGAIVDTDVVPTPDLPHSQPTISSQSRKLPLTIRTCSGKSTYVAERKPAPSLSYEQLIAARSTSKTGHARKSYYGIDIHQLMDDAAKETEELARATEQMQINAPAPSVERSTDRKGRTLMWTEKYRARKFTDLVGDERTHRSVLRWLKAWDPTVFPGSSRPKPKSIKPYGQPNLDEEGRHRKILLLTGPPGLGKTTLAHVCARQAGYEVQEINASDERSRDVVKGRIRDMVGTENVKGIETKTSAGSKVRKAGKPVCVVVDEVDGVVGGGGGGGEGGFIKALIDLVNLDQKNSAPKPSESSATTKRKKKGDNFRLLRPLILICNDVYHPSLRPLRQSSVAEIIHIRKPPLNMVVPRLHSIFEREGVPADTDGVRRLCEAAWGISSRKDGGGGGTGEGDVRGVMVVGEWVARKLMAESSGDRRLTRKWIEDHVLNDLSHGGGAARGLGRGGAKEVVDRVFKEGAGFPKSAAAAEASKADVERAGKIGVAEASKRFAMGRLSEIVNTSGDIDRIVTDCFTNYPVQPFQDDTLLSKPTAAYSWLHFHDSISSAVHGGQEWELAPYLSTPVLAFHDLFASSIRPSLSTTSTSYNNIKSNPSDPAGQDAEPAPFSGPSAPYQMHEQSKANLAHLSSFQAGLSLPLTRIYRNTAEIATELLPYVLRMLGPDVKPVVINTASSSAAPGDKRTNSATASVRKASEKALVLRSVNAMAATGVRFDKSRIDFGADARSGSGGWVFRMEPPLDVLGAFETMGLRKEDRVRFAVRQILDAEFRKESLKAEAEARKKRGGAAVGVDDAAAGGDAMSVDEVVEKEKVVVKRDFFGREIVEKVKVVEKREGAAAKGEADAASGQHAEGKVWVSYHEGFSNAVRKPITLAELLGGL